MKINYRSMSPTFELVET